MRLTAVCRMITRALIPIALIVGMASAQSPGQGGPLDISRTVLVTLTTRGILLSHSQFRPGRVRFLLQNRTPLYSPELQVNSIPDGGGPGNSVVLEKPANSVRNGRASLDTTLPPGTFALQIKGIPGVRAQIKVQP
jgi:hypothetical protein